MLLACNVLDPGIDQFRAALNFHLRPFTRYLQLKRISLYTAGLMQSETIRPPPPPHPSLKSYVSEHRCSIPECENVQKSSHLHHLSIVIAPKSGGAKLKTLAHT